MTVLTPAYVIRNYRAARMSSSYKSERESEIRQRTPAPSPSPFSFGSLNKSVRARARAHHSIDRVMIRVNHPPPPTLHPLTEAAISISSTFHPTGRLGSTRPARPKRSEPIVTIVSVIGALTAVIIRLACVRACVCVCVSAACGVARVVCRLKAAPGGTPKPNTSKRKRE